MQVITGLVRCLLFVVLFCGKVFPNENHHKTSHIRLPTAIVPKTYHLHIDTRIHEDIRSFNGNVTIELLVKEPTEEIVLHAKLLYDFEVSLVNLHTNEAVPGLRYVHEHRSNFLRVFSNTNPLDLKLGERYKLEILFTGEHQDTNFGFYRDTYLDDNQREIPMAITQFEPTFARLAFPCFDEPQLKAKFVISITHGSNYTALSNMPVDGIPVYHPETRMTTTKFLKTPQMSTYLIAIAISNYKHISESFNGIEYGVYFPPNSKDNGSHTLKNGINTLTTLENFFGIAYPLPKLDHIRVEKTYGIAMENWGLLTYNNKNFITNVQNNSLEEVQKIISQNHEIVHQWFGNLVTPKWWTYVWLKEGFAVYFSYIATQMAFPEKNMEEYFILREIYESFNHRIHHPLTIYVEEQDDIRKNYNLVSYRYAGCFLRMFHHVIGHKTFIKGVALYLKRFQYSVADENDLFNALQEAIDEDNVALFQNNKTTAIMRSWTHNIGMPILHVTRNFNENTITFHQRPKREQSSGEKWWIPLSFASSKNPNFERTTADYIMPPEEEVSVSLEELNLNITNSDWLMVDKQFIGLFHVIYDSKNLALIAEALKKDHKQIHRFNRAKLLHDIGDLESGNVAMESFLDIIQYLQFEDDLVVWEHAIEPIVDFLTQIQGSKGLEDLKAFFRGLVEKVFRKVFSNPSKDYSHLNSHQTSFKNKILKVACEVDLDDCLSYTQGLTNEYFLNGIEGKHSDSELTLCQGLKAAAFDEFKKLVNKVTAPDASTVKFYEFLYSLKCVKSLKNIKYFLEEISDKSQPNRKHRALSMVYFLNVEARPMIYEFLLERDKVTAESFRESAISMEKMQNEISSKQTFKKNFDERILSWLEKNYARSEKDMLNEVSGS